jgi:hypothetical protein
MAHVRFLRDEHAIARIPHSPEARALAAELGWRVALGARLDAPKRSGAGAASISPDLHDDAAGWVVDITWSQLRHYMYFHEVGWHPSPTSYVPPDPFLRPALDRYAHL